MGIYGYPPEQAARVALTTVVDHLRGETTLELARFVLFSESSRSVFDSALSEIQRDQALQ
jgi:O-acetyl-ADP-ribose deacetylase (regulator of RNase III)